MSTTPIVGSYPLEEYCEDPANPRTEYPERHVRALGENQLLHGQKDPIHSFLRADGKRQIVKGHTRYRAARLVGMTHLLTVEWNRIPTQEELSLLQLSLDKNRHSLSLWDRSRKLLELRETSALSLTELAKQIGFEQPTISKYLALGNLTPESRAALRESGCDLERAYFVSRETDPLKQLALAQSIVGKPRNELRRRSKQASSTTEKRASRAVFPHPDGTTITVNGPELTLSRLAALLQDLSKHVKQAQGQSLDIKTLERITKDRAKAQPNVLDIPQEASSAP